MEMQRRALFNSLRLNWLQNKGLDVDKWQVEDLRALATDKLFTRLSSFVALDQARFLALAEESPSPEELAETLTDESMLEEEADKLYLLVFEVWRRLLPDRLTLSIFGDSLDMTIADFDAGVASEETIAKQLSCLLKLLDEQADSDRSPDEVMQALSEYMASDVEAFLFDYICNLLDAGSLAEASELIEGFFPYVEKKAWFELLQAKVCCEDDPEEAARILWRLVCDPVEEPDCDLQFEILEVLLVLQKDELFIDAIKASLPVLERENDYIELVEMAFEYAEIKEDRARMLALSKILQERRNLNRALDAAFDLTVEVDAASKLLSELQWTLPTAN